jgi:hypothetical protein
MFIEASNMKKAEVIKTGNVNLKTVKLDKKNELYKQYIYWLKNTKHISPTECFNWLWERLS